MREEELVILQTSGKTRRLSAKCLPMSPTKGRKQGKASVNIHHTGEQILLHVLNTKD